MRLAAKVQAWLGMLPGLAIMYAFDPRPGWGWVRVSFLLVWLTAGAALLVTAKPNPACPRCGRAMRHIVDEWFTCAQCRVVGRQVRES